MAVADVVGEEGRGGGGAPFGKNLKLSICTQRPGLAVGGHLSLRDSEPVNGGITEVQIEAPSANNTPKKKSVEAPADSEVKAECDSSEKEADSEEETDTEAVTIGAKQPVTTNEKKRKADGTQQSPFSKAPKTQLPAAPRFECKPPELFSLFDFTHLRLHT